MNTTTVFTQIENEVNSETAAGIEFGSLVGFGMISLCAIAAILAFALRSFRD